MGTPGSPPVMWVYGLKPATPPRKSVACTVPRLSDTWVISRNRNLARIRNLLIGCDRWRANSYRKRCGRRTGGQRRKPFQNDFWRHDPAIFGGAFRQIDNLVIVSIQL